MDHDGLFKALLTTFFIEFLELFAPKLAAMVEPGSLHFESQELFADLISGEKQVTDVVASMKIRGTPSSVLIHVEHQAQPQAGFAQRMFDYFAALHLKFRRPIYPMAVFSYERPLSPETDHYGYDLAGLNVLGFRFHAIQLNQLAWQDFLSRENPVASALMTRMRIEPADRPRVKLECLRMLAGLKLDPARTQLVSGFLDNYLRLNPAEEQQMRAGLTQIEPEATREQAMEIITSWMEEGIAKGRQEGIAEGRTEEAANLVLRLLPRRVGSLDNATQQRIRALSIHKLEQLAEDLLDFQAGTDLDRWLEQTEQR